LYQVKNGELGICLAVVERMDLDIELLLIGRRIYHTGRLGLGNLLRLLCLLGLLNRSALVTSIAHGLRNNCLTDEEKTKY